MLNKVFLIGRLGHDPEVRYTTKDMKAVLTMHVATDSTYYNQQTKEQVKQVEWHRVVVWDKMAENCGKYLTKGSLIYVEGSLKSRKWQDKEGIERTSVEIIAQRIRFLSSRSQGTQEQNLSYDQSYSSNQDKRGSQQNQQRYGQASASDRQYGYGSEQTPAYQNRETKAEPVQKSMMDEEYGPALDSVPF